MEFYYLMLNIHMMGFCELNIHDMFEINHHAKCFDDSTSHKIGRIRNIVGTNTS
jgi:hypothetical protein